MPCFHCSPVAMPCPFGLLRGLLPSCLPATAMANFLTWAGMSSLVDSRPPPHRPLIRCPLLVPKCDLLNCRSYPRTFCSDPAVALSRRSCVSLYGPLATPLPDVPATLHFSAPLFPTGPAPGVRSRPFLSDPTSKPAPTASLRPSHLRPRPLYVCLSASPHTRRTAF